MPSSPRFRLRFALAALLVAVPGAAEPPADLQLEVVASGLSSPVAVRHAGDGSDRLFVVERGGRVRIVEGSSVLAEPFLDISATIGDLSGELGLLGLAFHPDYESNGFFYVHYAHGSSVFESVVERYSVSADPDVADPASGVEVISVDQPHANHNGGDLHFGPDGYLYLSLGDGGSQGDPDERAQDLGDLLGSILRLDVDGDAPYDVPPDNPFVGAPGLDEIWVYGLRNPWRFSFDRATGDLFVGDVGQNDLEEIDFQAVSSAGGENYGWDCREGSQPYDGIDSGTTPCTGPFVDPILEYGHALGCAVTGGYRYRGSRVAGFQGTYVYADFCSDRVWFATESSPGVWETAEWSDNTASSIAGFGEDEDGELYVVSLGGAVSRFVSPSSTQPLFADGFESGDTSAWTFSAP